MISDRIVNKLEKIVTDKNELKMIMELLEREDGYYSNQNFAKIKKDYQGMMDQYFPFKDSENE